MESQSLGNKMDYPLGPGRLRKIKVQARNLGSTITQEGQERGTSREVSRELREDHVLEAKGRENLTHSQ